MTSHSLVSEAAMSPFWRFTLTSGATRYRTVIHPCRWWDVDRVERMAAAEVTGFVRAAVEIDNHSDFEWASERRREAAVIGVMLGFCVRHAVAKARGTPCMCVHCWAPMTAGAGDQVNVGRFVEASHGQDV